MVTPPGVHVDPVRYEVSCLPMNDPHRASFNVAVVLERGGWSVKVHGFRCDAEGRRNTEPLPGESAEQWWSRHHFDLSTALTLAVKLAPQVTCNGYTVAEALADRGGDNERK